MYIHLWRNPYLKHVDGNFEIGILFIIRFDMAKAPITNIQFSWRHHQSFIPIVSRRLELSFWASIELSHEGAFIYNCKQTADTNVKKLISGKLIFTYLDRCHCHPWHNRVCNGIDRLCILRLQVCSCLYHFAYKQDLQERLLSVN